MDRGIKFIDLFAGIGGFHIALSSLGGRAVFASEWDKDAALVYENNFSLKPEGDITKISEKSIPDHDVLCAGFPCQAFSISGKQLGFEDSRGTLFFDVARIAKEKQPKVMFLENVKNLVSHDGGKTFSTMLNVLEELGYKNQDGNKWVHPEYETLVQDSNYFYLESDEDGCDCSIYPVCYNDFFGLIGCDVPEKYRKSWYEMKFEQDMTRKKPERGFFCSSKNDFYFVNNYNVYGFFYGGEYFNGKMLAMIFKTKDCDHLKEEYKGEFVELAAFLMSMRTMNMTWGVSNYYSQSCNYSFHKNFINVCAEIIDKKIEKEKVEKACDTYALNKLKKFVAERLDGDIKKLKDFDFYTLREDTEFGDERVSVVGLDSILMKSVLTLAFADTYPDFTYESMDKHKYKPDTINITNTIFGINFEDYYKALETYDAPAELRERVVRFGKKVHTIGNIMVLPSGLNLMRNTKPLGRGYCDVFLAEFYKMMIGAKKCNMKMLDALNLKKKEVAAFRTEENFNHIVHELMLEDFLDEEGKPKQVFQGLFSWEPGISRDTFIKAANEFLDFCEPFIDKRADRIIDKLEKVLSNNH